jgi:acyl transferase domain-containing protein
VEYALAQVWMSLGIEPVAMIGHSVGEFVAAVLSGVMRLEDALPVVVARGRLMQELPAGAMLAVRLPEGQLRELLGPGSAIAAVNAPTLSVASGPLEEIEALATELTRREIGNRRLQTSHAFHSTMVEPVIAPLEQLLSRIALSTPKLPYVSCVSGTWITPAEATSARYWARHARETVRFADGVTVLGGGDPAPLLLEVGPGNVTSTLALQTLGSKAAGVVTSLQDASRERSDRDCLLEALGRLWTLGAEPRWEALHEGVPRRVPLPT